MGRSLASCGPLGLFLVLAYALVLSPRPAQAVLIPYNFSATFADASTATGSFVYDTVAGGVTTASITTTAGTFPAKTFSQFRFNLPGFLSLLDPADGPNFLDDPTLDINFSPSLSAPMPMVSSVFIIRCFDAGCINQALPFTSATSVTLAVAAVPEPRSFWILLGGLCLLAAVSLRRRVRDGGNQGTATSPGLCHS